MFTVHESGSMPSEPVLEQPAVEEPRHRPARSGTQRAVGRPGS